MNQTCTVAQLAQHVGGTVVGDGAHVVSACHGLEDADAMHVSFVANAKYGKHLDTTRAGVVLVAPDTHKTVHRAADLPPLALIEVKDPYYAFQQAVVLLHGFRQQPAAGISPLAVVDPSAVIGADVYVGAYAVVASGVTIGAGSVIYPHVAIMEQARIGANCILYPHVTVYDACVLGDRVILHSGCVIGSDGYGFATHAGAHHKIPQVGNVILEDDVELGGNTVIQRAVTESTIIGKGSKLGDCVVIGHNTHVGPHNLFVSQVGLAGSATTGKYVVIGGQSGIGGHMMLGDGVQVAARSGVLGDVPAGMQVAGTPAVELKLARRVAMQQLTLPDLVKRIRELEDKVEKLSAAGPLA